MAIALKIPPKPHSHEAPMAKLSAETCEMQARRIVHGQNDERQEERACDARRLDRLARLQANKKYWTLIGKMSSPRSIILQVARQREALPNNLLGMFLFRRSCCGEAAEVTLHAARTTCNNTCLP